MSSQGKITSNRLTKRNFCNGGMFLAPANAQREASQEQILHSTYADTLKSLLGSGSGYVLINLNMDRELHV